MKQREALRTSTPRSEASDEIFLPLFHRHPLPMWVYDLETLAFLEVNLAAVEKYGYTREEFLKMTLKDIRPSEDVTRLLDTMAKMRVEQQHSGEWRHTLRNGRTIDVEITTHTLSYHGHKAALVIVQDITAKKDTEKVIQESDVRHRSLFENMLEGFAYCRMIFENDKPVDFEYLEVNSAFEKITGLKDVVGKRVTEVIPGIGESNPELFEIYGRAAQTGRPERFEVYLSPLHTWFSVSVYTMHRGFFASAFNDITERKRVQEALSESEQRFHQLFDEAPVGYHELDIHGCIVQVNRTELGMLGYTAEEMLHHPVWEFIVEREASREAIAAKIAGSIPSDQTFERTLRRKNGTTLKVLVKDRALRDEAGDVVGIRSALQDITDRKQVEEILRGSEERYRALVTFSPDSLYVHVDNRVTLVNPALCRLLGADDPSQLIGKTVFEIVHPEYHEKVRERLNLVFGGQAALPLEEKFIRLDGTVVDVEVHAVAIDWQGTKGVQVIARDITERKRAEEELQFRNVILSTQQEAAIDGILVVDEDGNVVSYNHRFVEMWGLAPELVEKRADEPILEFVTNKLTDPQSFLQRVQYLYEHKRETSRDEIVLKNGCIFDRYSAPMVGPDDRFFGRVWYFRDITEVKRAEEVVKESEERFRMVFDHVFDGISIYTEDPDPAKRRLVDCNDQYAAMAGRSREELLQRGSTLGLQKTLEDTANAIRLDSLIKGTAYQGSFSWIRPDGKDNVIEYVGVPITRKGKSYTIGIDRDITERKKAERELRLMAQTVASVRDCISVTDLENRFLFVNDAFRSTYGYTTEDLLGKDVSILRSPHSPAATADHILHDTLGGGWHGELLNRRKDGSELSVELWTSIVRDEAGIPVALVGVARDTTDRKRAEEVLRQSEELFRLIAENVGDMIAVVDLDGRRIYNSTSYKSILGDPETLKGTDGFQEIHPEDRDRVKQVFRETVRTGVGQRIEYRLIRKDGSVSLIDSKGSLIRDNDGKVSRVIIVSRDVTEEKKLAAQFLRAQRMESIGTLAGGIAHDLNNVLTPIMMAIEVLRKRIPDPGGQKILNTLETSAKRGSDIVRQVLAFGRGAQGDRILVQIKHVVNEVVKIAGGTLPKSIEIRTDIPRDLWTVSADPTQMHQVFLNMMVNARDAMPKGGILTISAENVTLDEHYSHMHIDAKPGTYVSVAVTDTGTGIPADIRERIFEPFFTTKEIGLGTGLGLSTTLAIIKSHEGFINLDSEMGKGTTFKIYIPATGTASRAAAAGEEAYLPMGNGELILVIDDEAAIREITKETLQAYGYEVLSASDGAEGVAVFAENKKTIKAVITDIMMPIMDGTVAIRALQRIDPDVKIIAASGLTTKGQITTPSDANVQAVLTKPYTAEKLLKALAALLR